MVLMILNRKIAQRLLVGLILQTTLTLVTVIVGLVFHWSNNYVARPRLVDLAIMESAFLLSILYLLWLKSKKRRG